MVQGKTVYTIGGTVRPDEGIYLSREADDELLRLCQEGEFAYVLTPRQMGKSSLMVQTARRLEAEGVTSLIIDLTKIGARVTMEQWYLGLLNEMDETLMFETDIFDWWDQHHRLGVAQRLTKFFEEVLLQEVEGRIVVFIDEIDTTLSLSFTDDFFIAIRYFYNARANKSNLKPLSFVLIGVATPTDLIKDPNRTPFNIGHKVELFDFTEAEAQGLTQGLGLPDEEAKRILSWMFKWTSGHPYLTQKLCQSVLEGGRNTWNEQLIDQLVKKQFLDTDGTTDSNLQFVRDMLTERAPNPSAILVLYQDIWRERRKIPDKKQSLIYAHLKLSGIAKDEGGFLLVRNQIYKTVFSSVWIDQSLPINLEKFLDKVQSEPSHISEISSSRPAALPGIYTVGGSVDAGEGIYISRRADSELLKLCFSSQFGYILTPRQVGKTSLMVRTARILAEAGITPVIIDLTKLGTEVTLEQWYLGLLTEMDETLEFETNIFEWWKQHERLGVTQRLVVFLEEVLLREVNGRIVVFVDEIDTTLSLNFTDDFFVAIRYSYVARAQKAEFERLSFVLLGVASPGDLIGDPQRTPFNVGQRVNLTDFTAAEAQPLMAGLAADERQAQEILQWVLAWTGGHPYLTQRLCEAIVAERKERWTADGVRRLVETLFFVGGARNDNNLLFVRDMLTQRTPNGNNSVYEVLMTYREVWRGKQIVMDEEQSLIKSHLKLSGIVRRDYERGSLYVSNAIYQGVFDERWVNEHLPVNWARSLRRVQLTFRVAAATFLIAIVPLLVLLQEIEAQKVELVEKYEADLKEAKTQIKELERQLESAQN